MAQVTKVDECRVNGHKVSVNQVIKLSQLGLQNHQISIEQV